MITSQNQLLYESLHQQYFFRSYFNVENETTTSRHWGSNIPVNCDTESTEHPSSPCIFPYEYKGKMFYECIHGLFGYYDYDDWCPTELDGNNQPHNWGRCGENCPSSTSRNNQDYYDSTDISPKFASKLNFIGWPVITI